MRARAVLAILSILTLAGCNLNTDYFKDYRGKNLLASWDFGALDASSNPKWALESYSDYATGGADAAAAAPYFPTDYMTWAHATDLASVGDGLVTSLSVGKDNTSPAYRLEIKNLFKDGDFETQAGSSFSAPDNGWWSTNANAAVQFATSPSTFTSNVDSAKTFSPIDSTSLFFTGSTSGNQLKLTLGTTSSVPLWYRPGGYRFRFEFRYTGAQTTFHANLGSATNLTAENSGLWDVQSLASQSSTQVSFSHYFTLGPAAATAQLTLGSASNFDEAVIDDVRVVHNDIPPYVTMSFPSLNSGSLQLLPGSKSGDYTFSFYVHDDPTADQTNALHNQAANLNRLEPSGITVQVTAAVKSGSGTYIHFVQRPSGGWIHWTPVSLPMGFDFVNSDSSLPLNTPALKIEIAPTNTQDLSTNGRDVGSVLIAQPTLTFNP